MADNNVEITAYFNAGNTTGAFGQGIFGAGLFGAGVATDGTKQDAFFTKDKPMEVEF